MNMRQLSMESGRSVMEMIAILAIVGVLSVSGVWYYSASLRENTVDEVLNTLSMKTVEIHSILTRDQVRDPEQVNKVLESHTTQVKNYQLTFHAAPDSENMFVSEITRLDGKPIRGAICKDLIRKMAEQKFISDVDFTVHNQNEEDGTEEDVNVRLNGKVLNMSAVCGS